MLMNYPNSPPPRRLLSPDNGGAGGGGCPKGGVVGKVRNTDESYK